MRLAFLSIGRHIHTERWIRWFAERGHECHLLTVQPGPVDGVTVHDITRAGPTKPCALLALLRAGEGPAGRAAARPAQHPLPDRLRLLGRLLGLPPQRADRLGRRHLRDALRECTERLAGPPGASFLRCADRRLRRHPADRLRPQLGADPGVLPGALGRGPRGVPPRDARGVRGRLGFGPDDVVFFSPRSYTQPYYNIDVVIAAAAQVHAKEPRARFLFAGYEGDPAPFEAGRWRRRARRRSPGSSDASRTTNSPRPSTPATSSSRCRRWMPRRSACWRP